MKKFLAFTAVFMISSATLVAQAVANTETKDLTVEAEVESETRLDVSNATISLEKINTGSGANAESGEMTVKSNCTTVTVTAQTDGKMLFNSNTIPFEASVLKDGAETKIEADQNDQGLKKVTINSLKNDDKLKIKVKISPQATPPAAGKYTGKITLTVTGQ